MSMPVPTRCAAPSIAGRSTYTVLGFLGYGVANVACALLMWMWRLSLSERLLVTLVPPIAFVVVVFAARLIVGRERIVFYQTSVAGVAVVAIASALGGTRTARLVDIATSASASSSCSAGSAASRSRAATAALPATASCTALRTHASASGSAGSAAACGRCS